MIFIVVRFPVRPEHADGWMDRVAAFTHLTRAEPVDLGFDWSRGVEDPNEYMLLLEAFRDPDAGAAHVATDHLEAGVPAGGDDHSS